MLDKDHRICPCCGKRLALTGEVMGGRQHERIGGYRSDTYAQHYHHAFERDKLWYCRVDMFCGECKAQVKLQSNPAYLLVYGMLLVFAAVVVSVIFGIWIADFSAYAIIAAVAAAIIGNIALVCAYVYRLRYIKRWRSNFVYVSNSADKADVTLKAAVLAVPRQILYPANIFLLRMKERSAALYLIGCETRGDFARLSFRICCEDNAKDGVIDYIGKNSGALTLEFEGHIISQAELIAISDKT